MYNVYDWKKPNPALEGLIHPKSDAEYLHGVLNFQEDEAGTCILIIEGKLNEIIVKCQKN
jgi:hypothetical protein